MTRCDCGGRFLWLDGVWTCERCSLVWMPHDWRAPRRGFETPRVVDVTQRVQSREIPGSEDADFPGARW